MNSKLKGPGDFLVSALVVGSGEVRGDPVMLCEGFLPFPEMDINYPVATAAKAWPYLNLKRLFL